jgi:hypothetical protein
MPQPGAPHRRLAKLVGRWVGEEKLMPPGDPNVLTATGKETNTLAVDDFVVVQDCEMTRDGKVSFRGHGMFTWNDSKKCYELVWADSIGGALEVFAGNWKGDVLEMANESPQGRIRCTFDVSGGGYKFTMSMSQDGKNWAPMRECKYSRKG